MRARWIWPAALVGFLYVATWPFHEGLNNPNELVRVYMTKAIVDYGTFSIDPVVREWGYVDDKAVRDGRLYSSKAPLMSLAGVPAYWLLKKAFPPTFLDKRSVTIGLRLLTVMPLSIAFAWILLAWIRRRAEALGLGDDAGVGVGLALCLGTMLYPYGITFSGHSLAAITAGGAYLAVLELLRDLRGPRATRFALLAGFLGGAAPFAEYPAALVALPALLTPLIVAGDLRLRGRLAALMAAAGAIPFGLGLWAHKVLWGSPFATGYSFLENKGYVEVHRSGFFGVTGPKLPALLGALFSPGTGLFFFSPILALGLIAMTARAFGRSKSDLPRSIAIAGVLGFCFETLFISSHHGWRGGWTVGPRYIIPLAPMLGVWVLESAASGRAFMRALISAGGAASIVFTGFAAALYPHLSDVYTNPVWTMLWPSYRRGEMSYGIAHSLGLSGHAANLVHVSPLLVALGVAFWGPITGLGRRSLALAAGVFVLLVGGSALIREPDPGAAQRENERLWGFWEPARPDPIPKTLLYKLRDRAYTVAITAIGADGTRHPCLSRPGKTKACFYGPEEWHRFEPESIDFDGKRERVLFLHPIAGQKVEASVRVPADAKEARLTYGLSDGSIASPNTSPVELLVTRGERELLRTTISKQRGLQRFSFPVEGSEPIRFQLSVATDGARIFGFDIEFHRGS